MTDGTLISADDGWHLSTPTGTKPVPLINLTPKVAPSIEEQWLQDIATENTDQSIADAQAALDLRTDGLVSHTGRGRHAVLRSGSPVRVRLSIDTLQRGSILSPAFLDSR